MFLLAGRGLSYAPRLMMTHELLSSMIPTSRNALLIQHNEACTSVSAFLVRLLDPETHRKCDAQQVKTLEMTFYPCAGVITQLALAGGVGALPPSRMYNMVDVLYALLKSSTGSIQWFSASISLIPLAALSETARQRFLQTCQSVVADEIQEDDEQQLLDAVFELSEICRRHHKIQQTVMQSLLPKEYQYFNI